MSQRTFKIMTSGLIAAIIICDQITKWWIYQAYLAPPYGMADWLARIGQPRGGFVETPVTPFFNLVLVWNEGVSFGMLQGMDMALPLIVLALSISVALFIWMLRSPHKIVALALASVIGGALSNAWDRVRFGAVLDFLDFHALGWHWPAFNLADSMIVIGIALLLIDGLVLEPARNQEEQSG